MITIRTPYRNDSAGSGPQRHRPKKTRDYSDVLVSLALVASLAGLIVYYRAPGEEAGAVSLTGEAKASRAALARIEAESRGIVLEPQLQAPPRSSETPPLLDGSAEETVHSPPEGYSFVSYHGEMPRARIAVEVDAGDEPAGPGPDWLDAVTSIEVLATQASAAGRDWSFGWVRLAEDAKPNEVTGLLSKFGATALGSSGHLVRAQLPGEPALLQEIAALPEVDGLGAVPVDRKLSERFVREAREAPPQEQAPVFITLMTDDPDGRWRRSLEDQGVVVARFDPDLRAYTASLAYDQVESIATLDYVLAIERVGIVRPAHDTAVPAMGADVLRAYDGSPGIFSGMGGASVPIGVMDTGLNVNHLDISSNRESICGANFVWYVGGPDGTFREAEDLWIDEGGHGTHVTGTIGGNGTVQPRFAGMAPAVRHIRFAKVLSLLGYGSFEGIFRGMDFLAEATGCAEEGRSSVAVKPLIVNMSLAATSRTWEGRGSSERKLDSIVWSHRQLYVVAQSNANINGFSNFGTAKSSLSVGAALDSGDLVGFSSHGPTADGRLAPQVVATGVRVHSTRGDGSRGEYVALSGTSMASPTVAGVAALLMDVAPEHRERPALARARLMAGAIRPDPWLDAPDAFPSTNTGGPGSLQAQYGLGKVSARTSVLNRSGRGGWHGGGAWGALTEGEIGEVDIEVPVGASRLDLVMTWDEPPADTVTSTVLNDLDLWLDRDGNCGDGACGEHSSASRVDNVEWIIVRNPRPGTYRAKVVARRVYTAPPRAALAWTVIRGASTPNLVIDTDRTRLVGDGEQDLTVTVTADEYVAAGSRLHLDCRDTGETSGCEQLRIDSMAVSREDGVSVDLTDEVGPLIRPGVSIPLGEVAAGETQEVRFGVSSVPMDPVRLYFTASAWNATAASVSVEVAPNGGRGPGRAQSPAHDEFASAAVIGGQQGSHEVDLVLATPEPGEPSFTSRQGRPAGSVWYRWTAPADGAVRFNLHPPEKSGDGRDDRVDVFRGDRISTLETVSSNQWRTQFFAKKEQSYRIRVSHLGRGTPVDLRWSQGDRPVNDNFARATDLEGDAGEVEGTTQGATLEPGEWFGGFAGTTWHRWTAPDDGRWAFSSEPFKYIFVFEGDDISTLRLVSDYRGSYVSFPAGAGRDYHVAVADRNAYESGGPYELSWKSSNRYFPANDDIVDAEEIESEPSSQHIVCTGSSTTVEPGEPLETGVRTRWWVWEAPASGRYTWRLEDGGQGDPHYPKLQLTVFTGPSSEDLQFLSRTGPDTVPSDFVLQARGGHRYWLTVGFPTGDIAAYSTSNSCASMTWGPTPDNNHLARAATLTGAAGSLSGSNRFATLERGERGSVLGHSSLWWTYEATATGWHRFWVDDPDGSWVLAVYREGGDGFGGLEFVRSSHQPEGVETDGIEVIVHAEERERYTIRLGGRGRGGGGDFTMHWGETEPPVWLKYAARLADGDLDASGTSVQLSGPSSLAFNDRGTALYVASKLGLQVFERDPRTGGLTFVQLLEDDGLEDASLIWDPHRDQLYAHRCGTWRRFAPLDETQQELEDEGTISVSGDPPDASECGVGVFGDVFMDGGGSFLNAVLPSAGRLQVLALDAEGDLRHVQTLEVHGLKRAVISNGGSHVYAVTDFYLVVFRRDANTSRLTQTAYRASLTWRAEALAITSDDRYLFVFDGDGTRTNVYDLEQNPSNPSALDRLPQFWARPWSYGWRNQCRFASARRGIPAVDVFCQDVAFAVQWQPESDALAVTDFVAPWQQDRFNHPVPDFGPTRNLAASPDGRHAYLDTEDQGIVVFERVGLGAPPPPSPVSTEDLLDGRGDGKDPAGEPGRVPGGRPRHHRVARAQRHCPGPGCRQDLDGSWKTSSPQGCAGPAALCWTRVPARCTGRTTGRKRSSGPIRVPGGRPRHHRVARAQRCADPGAGKMYWTDSGRKRSGRTWTGPRWKTSSPQGCAGPAALCWDGMILILRLRRLSQIQSNMIGSSRKTQKPTPRSLLTATSTQEVLCPDAP